MKNCETLKRDKSNTALNLCNHLQEVNKTVEDVALDLGVSTRTIYHWNSGERILNLDYFLFIERESTKENKQKIKSFYDFDNRLIKVLGL